MDKEGINKLTKIAIIIFIIGFALGLLLIMWGLYRTIRYDQNQLRIDISEEVKNNGYTEYFFKLNKQLQKTNVIPLYGGGCVSILFSGLISLLIYFISKNEEVSKNKT